VPAIAPAALDREPDHLLDACVALIVVESDQLRVAPDADRELHEIIGSDREAVEQLGEGVDLDHVVQPAHRDFKVDLLSLAGCCALAAPTQIAVEDAAHVAHEEAAKGGQRKPGAVANQQVRCNQGPTRRSPSF